MSACALRGCDESVVHPEGERLPGFVGGGLHEPPLVDAGSDAEDLATWVVDRWTSASLRLGHDRDNIRPRKELTETLFQGHNKCMTKTAVDKTIARHWCSCGRGFYNKAGMLNHGRKCEVETARSRAWIQAAEAGIDVRTVPAAWVQMPREARVR